MNVTTVSQPYSQASERHARYNASDKGKARRTKYRHDNSKWTTDTQYLAREFTFWDGEGVTLDDGSHIYVMLANSRGGYIADAHGLPSHTILDFLLSESAKYPDDIHCIYGGSYDFNMWLSDLTQAQLRGIYERDYSRYGPYLIQWRRGKSFFVKLYNEEARGITVYDVVSFFQCSFIKACDSYLGERFAHRDVIVAQKANRSAFELENMAQIRTYNEYELENGVALMEELRSRLNAASLRPRRWDGPGAVASALMTREGVKSALAECPDPVAEAARYAYFGGRFEPIKYGTVWRPCYEYDVNSAYPYALQFIPNLSRGQWEYVENPAAPTNPQGFALWHVKFRGNDFRLPMPLPWRSPKGNVVYPGDGAFYGWYWTPDVWNALEYCKRYGGSLEIQSAWFFREDNPLDRPFAFVPELYRERQVLKRIGNGAHVGIKLALNSMYGKLAQQVGAREYDNGWRLPPFHQLEYAGYVTATCRGKVYIAGIEDLRNVIAYETDALFTCEPVSVNESEELGDWEATRFDNLTYVQSGLYYGDSNGQRIAKTRGVNLGTLSRETVIEAMESHTQCATAPLTQFITAGLALRGRWDEWRRWITTEKQIQVEPQGKRIALPGDIPGEWSLTFAARVREDSHSSPFPVLWINPDSGMDELSEMRDMGTAEFVGEVGSYAE